MKIVCKIIFIYKTKGDYRLYRKLMIWSQSISFCIYATYGNFIYFLKIYTNKMHILETVLIILILLRETNNGVFKSKLEEFLVDQSEFEIRIVIQVILAILVFGLSILILNFNLDLSVSTAVYMFFSKFVF